ncbi:MAG: YceD family protein [Cyanobacteriota bacterium]
MSPAPIHGALAPISLTALGRHADGVCWDVDQPISGLASLTPVRGRLLARHLGSVVEVEGNAEAIITLCCDRCLQHYNHSLQVRQHELLDIADAPPPDSPRGSLSPRLVAADDDGSGDLGPDERLNPRGSFDPERWLFEQLSLQQPTVNRCGSQCSGPPSWGDGDAGGDPRWAALIRLRQA